VVEFDTGDGGDTPPELSNSFGEAEGLEQQKVLVVVQVYITIS